MPSLSINSAIARESELAKVANPDISFADIAFLMEERLNFTPSMLKIRGEDEIPVEILNQFESDVQQLIAGASPQYILGYSWFLGEKIMVNHNVLIPRFETEELVGWVANDLLHHTWEKSIDILDLGTGSGAITVGLFALTKNMREKKINNFTMTASDISSTAISVARKNFYDRDLHVKTVVADVLTGLAKFDIVISNPPYIMDDEVSVMDKSVIQNEPFLALFAGLDGLDFYRKFVKQIDKHLNAGGYFYLEFGYHQRALLLELFEQELPEYELEFKVDMSGQDRMIRGQKPIK